MTKDTSETARDSQAAASRSRVRRFGFPMKIELLMFDDCPNHHAASDLLREVLDELDVDDPIENIEVADPETGERLRFPGSPTIRINGMDVDPEYEDTGDYALRCRVYLTGDGFKGVPERRWIETAVESAA